MKFEGKIIQKSVKRVKDLIRARSEINWQLADLLAAIRKQSPHIYRELRAILTHDKRELHAKLAGLSGRDNRLLFEHHIEVCNLTASQRRYWLNYAFENSLTPVELRRAIRLKGQSVADSSPVGIKVNPAIALAVRLEREIKQGRITKEDAMKLIAL